MYLNLFLLSNVLSNWKMEIFSNAKYIDIIVIRFNIYLIILNILFYKYK